jgi:hypothetical protein
VSEEKYLLVFTACCNLYINEEGPCDKRMNEMSLGRNIAKTFHLRGPLGDILQQDKYSRRAVGASTN